MRIGQRVWREANGWQGEALDEGIRSLRDERLRLTESNRFCEAVLDDAPAPLLTVDAEGRVELANKAARRLFVRHHGVRIEDYRIYGETFATALDVVELLDAGER